MDRNKHASSFATLPALTSSGSPAGFFTKGNPSGSVVSGIPPNTPATVPTADWANGITEELINVIVQSGQTPSQTDLTQLASAIANIGKRKTLIINGNFDLWQRGTSLSAAGYLADRFTIQNVGNTVVQSQQAFALGQTEVPNFPKFFHRAVVTSVPGAANVTTFEQRIEDVVKNSAQTYTLTFWAKANNTRNITLSPVQYFGGGGSPSAVVVINPQTINISTVWTKYTRQIAVPSVSGKSLGTNNNDYLSVRFFYDAGSNFNSDSNTLGQGSCTIDIAQVQLEPGNIGTAFESQHVTQIQRECYRYYETNGTNTRSVIAWGGTLTTALPSWGFIAPKRAIPTFSVVLELGAGGAFSVDAYGFYQSVATSGATGVTYKADAEL